MVSISARLKTAKVSDAEHGLQYAALSQIFRTGARHFMALVGNIIYTHLC
jgi:hypothetical protein